MTGGDQTDALIIACRLVEKAVRRGKVYIQCVDAQQQAQLNEKLWSFRPDAFVPHEINKAEAKQLESVVLGTGLPPESFHDILVNMTDQIPKTFARFERLLEVVPAEHEARAASRTKFRFYKERGYPLQTHDISP